MDREQMKMAMLKQEQMFRQQVHELHRLYHVQKQLMKQTQATAANHAPAIVVADPKPHLTIMHREKATNPQQFYSFSSCKAPAPAPSDECNLELTLATGTTTTTTTSSSGGGGGNTGMQQGKRLKSSSNSDSGTTAASSTSTESELARFKEVDVTATTVRFQGEGRRMDDMGQAPWMHQCLSLKMA